MNVIKQFIAKQHLSNLQTLNWKEPAMLNVLGQLIMSVAINTYVEMKRRSNFIMIINFFKKNTPVFNFVNFLLTILVVFKMTLLCN